LLYRQRLKAVAFSIFSFAPTIVMEILSNGNVISFGEGFFYPFSMFVHVFSLERLKWKA